MKYRYMFHHLIYHLIYRTSLLIILITLITLPVTGNALAQGIDEPQHALRRTDGKDADAAGAYYVRYKEGYKRAALAAINATGARITHKLDVANTVAVLVSEATLDALRSDPNVEFIEPVPEHHPTAQVVPWNIDMVQARDVWDADRDGTIDPGAPDGSGVKLCIIDSGFYAAHDDFQGITASGESQISGENWWEDGLGHGTHVAGIANAVNNTIGVVGVMPGGAELYIVKIFDNAGNWVSGQSDLAAAAQACRDAGANAISMSLGGSYSATEDAVFQDLYDNYGIINIAAAGNDGDNSASYPASYDSVISVAALREDEVVASFTQFPPTGYDPNNPPANTEWDVVELSAGGEGVLSTVPYVDGNVPFYQITPDGGDTYSGYHIDESGITSPGGINGILVNGGLCDSVGAWAGNIVLCERGDIAFADKINNVQDGGGIGAVIYNNQPGNFNGTCGGNCYATPIPAISLSQADGQALLPGVGTNSTLIVDDGSSCTTCTGGYDYMSGTSMATPGAAAGVAWVWDACGGSTGITNKELRQLLRDSAKDLAGTRQDDAGNNHTYGNGYDVHSGWGLIQLKAALDLGGERFGWQTCPPPGPFVIDPHPREIAVCALAPTDAVYDLAVGGKDFQGDIGLSVTGHPAGTTAIFADPTVHVPNTGDWISTTLTIGNTGAAASGSYTLTIQGVDQADASSTFTVDVQLDVVAALPGAATLTTPPDGSTDVSATPTFMWTTATQANSYAIDIATDPGFANIVETASGLTGTSYTPSSALNNDTVYYWRVRAANICGDTTSTTYAFRTEAAPSCGPTVLEDPSFELGASPTSPWAQTSTNFGSPLCTNASCGGPPPAPSDGTWWGWFGGIAAPETASLEQNITLPTGATAIALNFDFQAAVCNLAQDYFRIFIDGTQVFNVQQGNALCGAGDYSPQSIDLTAYPGNRTLRIEGYSRGHWLWGWSNFYVDNLSITSTCPPGSATTADYSDLDSTYGIAWHTGDGSLRLGTTWTADTTFSAGSDDSDDGVSFSASLEPGEQVTVSVDVQGTPSGANGWLRGWFDWNYNGVFDTDELEIDRAVGVALHNFVVTGPATVSGPVNYRFRLYDSAGAPMAPLAIDNRSYGGTTGGEVEDDTSPVPTAVRLTRFAAVPDGAAVRVEWETATELDNLGFNLYRSTTPEGPYTQLNANLIPAQNPGQVLGAVYTWRDENVPADSRLYYKLEDVDIHGIHFLHGPVGVNVQDGPTAQTLMAFTARRNLASLLIPLATLICAGGIMWSTSSRRKQRTAQHRQRNVRRQKTPRKTNPNKE